MKPIIPDFLVPVAGVSSFLYRSSNPDYLGQDQLTVALRNGYYIDVSWHPEHNPTGTYIIRVFFEFADNERIDPIEIKDLDEMISKVQSLVVHFSQHQIPVSATTQVQLNA